MFETDVLKTYFKISEISLKIMHLTFYKLKTYFVPLKFDKFSSATIFYFLNKFFWFIEEIFKYYFELIYIISWLRHLTIHGIFSYQKAIFLIIVFG